MQMMRPVRWSLLTPAVTLDENTNTARKLTDITFTDQDTSAAFLNNSARIPNSDIFEIRNGTELWLKANAGTHLDHDTTARHQVTVTAVQNPSLTQTFTLTLTDLNDEAPVITSGATGTAIDEGTAPSAVLYTATATPDLSGDAIVWSLSGGDSASFTIDSQTGEVTFARPGQVIMSGRHDFTGAGSAQKGSLTIHGLQLEAVSAGPAGNRYKLHFEFDNVATAVSAEIVAGTAFGEVRVKLGQGGATLDEIIAAVNKVATNFKAALETPSTGGTRLQIDTDTTLPDFETNRDGYSFDVVATTRPGQTDEQAARKTVTIAVTNLDEAGIVAPWTNTTPEQGQRLVAPALRDPDGTVSGQTMEWQRSSNGKDGWAQVATGSFYDLTQADANKYIRVKYSYTDPHGANKTAFSAATAQVTDIDDAPTAFVLATPAVTLDENTNTAQKLTDITFTDEDTNAAFRNNIATVPASDIFEIRNRNELWLKDGAVLDHETTDQHQIVVSSTGLPDQTFTLTLKDINDVTPDFTWGGSVPQMVEENTTFNGASDTVHIPSASAYDDIGTVTWSLDGGDAGSGPGKLTISRTGALIFFGGRTTLDYETKSSYTTTVVMTVTHSSGVLTERKTFALNVKDVAEKARSTTLSPVQHTLDENTDTTSRIKVADIQVDEPDSAEKFWYTLGLGGADHDKFELGTRTRTSTELFLKAGTVLDHETASSLVVVVDTFGSGPGSNPPAQTFTLNVRDLNDNAPVITSAATGTALPENTAAPTSQILYTATGTTDVTGDSITWTLENGDHSSFSINADGEVTFKTATTPDFETNRDGYSFDVVATVGSLSSRQTVTIAVTDADDAPSAMVLTTPAVTLDENTNTAQKLTDITFTDEDSNAAFLNNTATVPNSDIFEIRNGTELWLKANAGTHLDREAASQHQITVTSVQNPALTASFTLNVENIDEGMATVTVAGIPRVGEVLTASLSGDPDGDPQANAVTWEWQYFVGGSWAVINGANMASYTLVQVDEGRMLRAVASYTDGGKTTHSAVASAQTAAVEPQNLAPTAMVIDMASATIDETASTTAARLATVTFTDADGKANGITISGDDAGLFEIRDHASDEKMKELWLKSAQSLNYEIMADRMHEITLTSDENPSLTVAFTLTVADADDAPTAFALATSAVTLDEGTNTARKLTDITFTDEDTNAAFLNNSATVPTSDIFEIRNGDELWLKANAGTHLDHDTTAQHQIVVSSTGLPAQTFTLTLKDINDEAPDITSAATGDALPENAVVPTSQVLYTATATTDLSTDVVVWSLSGGDSGPVYD